MRKIGLLVLLLLLIAATGLGACSRVEPPQDPPVQTEDPVTPEEPEEPDDVREHVRLYFGNANADAVVAEIREILYPENITREDYLTLVLTELAAGPEREDLFPTIPEGVRVLSLTIEGDLVLVDFSEEMSINHWGGAAGESMTLNSIANTLTEFEDVKRVMLTVEGDTMLLEHILLDEPLERNPEMIGE